MFLRLFAPFLPFATEEVWSWTHEGSVHTAAWPTPLGIGGEPARAAAAPSSEALIGIRRAKTEAKASQKTEVTSADDRRPRTAARGARRPPGRRVASPTVDFVEADAIEVRDIVLAEATE